MKRFYCLLAIAFAAIQAHAQSIEIYHDEVIEDISGTTIDVTIPSGEEEGYVITTFMFKVFGDPFEFRIERYKVEEQEEAEDFLYSGTNLLFGGSLYSPTSLESANPWVEPESHSLDNDSTGVFRSFYINGEAIGCGLYRYYIINEDAERLDSVDINFCSTLSLPVVQDDVISVYPNPSQGELSINLPNVNSTATAELYSLQGERVMSVVVQDESPINLSHLENGFYVLALKDSYGTLIYTQKITLTN